MDLDIKDFTQKPAGSDDFLLGVDSDGVGFQTPVRQFVTQASINVDKNTGWTDVPENPYRNATSIYRVNNGLVQILITNMDVIYRGDVMVLGRMPDGLRPDREIFAVFSVLWWNIQSVYQGHEAVLCYIDNEGRICGGVPINVNLSNLCRFEGTFVYFI